MVRKIGNLFTPSIKDALSGNSLGKNIEEEAKPSEIVDYEDYSEPFTPEQLEAKWNEYLALIADRPNLRSTLSTIPEIVNGTQLQLGIGNSVQEEEIRIVKPELVSWLRRELRNSKIELITVFKKLAPDETRLTDQQKMQKLIQKNPNLVELSKKFNLDFTD